MKYIQNIGLGTVFQVFLTVKAQESFAVAGLLEQSQFILPLE